jgi:hypothetical protein
MGFISYEYVLMLLNCTFKAVIVKSVWEIEAVACGSRH